MPFETGFRVTSPFGPRVNPFTGEAGSWHGGLDLAGADTRVVAAVSGTVLQSRIIADVSNPTWEWGNYVSIYGDDGRTYFYCHLASRAVSPGDRVEEGQLVGIEGATGHVTGVHLHFEVRSGNVQINPAPLLGIENAAGVVWAPASDPVPEPEPAWKGQASSWALESVGRMISAGILRGRGGDDWGLRESVTVEQMCVFLDRLAAAVREGKV